MTDSNNIELRYSKFFLFLIFLGIMSFICVGACMVIYANEFGTYSEVSPLYFYMFGALLFVFGVVCSVSWIRFCFNPINFVMNDKCIVLRAEGAIAWSEIINCDLVDIKGNKGLIIKVYPQTRQRILEKYNPIQKILAKYYPISIYLNGLNMDAENIYQYFLEHIDVDNREIPNI